MTRWKAQLLALHNGVGDGGLDRCFWVEQGIGHDHQRQQTACGDVAFGRRVQQMAGGLAQVVLQVMSYAHATFIVHCG